MNTPPLRLNCVSGRSVVASLGVAQLGYVLVQVLPSFPSRRGAPLNLGLALDRSGSMEGAKLAALKAAVGHVIDRLGPADTLSVVAFDETCDAVMPATPVTDRSALKAKIDRIEAAGGTAIGPALDRALAEVGRASSAGLRRLILVTDGQTWGDDVLCRQVAERAGQAETPIFAFGLGDDWNADLLDAIARASGGQSGYIAGPEHLEDAFDAALAAFQSTVARQSTVTLQLAEGCTIRSAWRVVPLIEPLAVSTAAAGNRTLSLGDLDGRDGQVVLIEVRLPVRPPGTYRIAVLTAAATLNSTIGTGVGRVVLPAVDIVLRFALDGAAESPLDTGVLNVVERITVYRLQADALAAARTGASATATAHLQAAATRFLELGEVELAEAATAEADRLDRGEDLSAVGEKTLRYQTRRLTQRLGPTQILPSSAPTVPPHTS